MSFQPDDSTVMEDNGRCAEQVTNEWGETKKLLRGLKKEEWGVAAELVRVGATTPAGPRGHHAHEAMIRTMAGQALRAELTDHLTPAQQDQLSRHYLFMALGPVFTKRNELTMAKMILEEVGGNPGNNWMQVVALLCFVGVIARERTREKRKKLLLHWEAVEWVSRYQAALQGVPFKNKMETQAMVDLAFGTFQQAMKNEAERRMRMVAKEMKELAAKQNATVVASAQADRSLMEVMMSPIIGAKRSLTKAFGGKTDRN